MPSLLIDVTGKFDKFQDNLKRLNKDVDDSANKLEKSSSTFKKALEIILPAVTIAGIVALTKSAIDAAASLDDLSQRLRVSTEDISALQLISKQAGIGVETTASAVAHLNQEAENASGGVEKSAEAFKILGVNVETTKDLLGDTVKALSEFKESTNKAALETQLFGSSATQIVPMLNRGVEAFKESAAFAKLYAESTTDTAIQSKAFQAELAKSAELTKTFGRVMAAETAPSLVLLSKEFNKLLEYLSETQYLAELLSTGFKYLTVAILAGAEGIRVAAKDIGELYTSMTQFSHLDFNGIGQSFKDLKDYVSNVSFDKLKNDISTLSFDKLKQSISGVSFDKLKAESSGFFDKLEKDLSKIDINKIKDQVFNAPKAKRQEGTKEAPPQTDFTAQRAKQNQELENYLKQLERQGRREKDILSIRTESLNAFYRQDIISLQDDISEREKYEDEYFRNQTARLEKAAARLRKEISIAPDDATREKRKGDLERIQDEQLKLIDDVGKRDVKNWEERNNAAIEYANSLNEVNAKILEQKGFLLQAEKLRQENENRHLEARPESDVRSKTLLARNKEEQQIANTMTQITELRNKDSAAVQRMTNQEEALQLLRESGAISEFQRLAKSDEARKQEGERLRGIADQYRELIGTLEDVNGEYAALADAYDIAAERMVQSTDQLAKTFNSTFADASTGFLDDLTSGTKSVSNAFADMAKSIERSLTHLISQNLMEQLFSQNGAAGGAANWLSALFSNSGGGASIAASLFAKGGAFWQGAEVTPFAAGGVINSPRFFKAANGAIGLAGEAGSEGILPLKRGRDGKLGVSAQGAMSGGDTIIMNISTPDVKSFAESRGQTAKKTAQFIASARRDQ